MAAVDNYRQRLAALQGSWDTLSLLSHLSGNGTDMTHTRQAFEALASDLLTQLENETHKKTVQALKASAQISIDIIVRNLYERTADVGFLCADDELRRFTVTARASNDEAAIAADKKCIRARLREYVAKYSVYSNVIVLDTDGRVLVQLHEDNDVKHSRDPLIGKTIGTSGYVETFGKSDLEPTQQHSLIYSARICEGSRPIGVLCLCFKFDDEVAGIFGKLTNEHDWTLFTFLDAQGRVIASSDPWQIPIGIQLDTAFDATGKVVRACGREYLAVTRSTNGYQGYLGPGWFGHALVPIEHAFDNDEAHSARIPAEILASLHASHTIFSKELRGIPVQADNIQRELNRTVWNGNVGLSEQGQTKNDFAKVLLWEIGNAGVKTKETFERSIGELHQTVMSSILSDAQLLASLAVDILDRNLYERANDCRWWALTPTLIEELTKPQPDGKRIEPVLRYINSLYTVYRNIVVVDTAKRVIAVSNPTAQSMVGKKLTEEWADRTLQLRDSQQYCVSQFDRSQFYDNEHTLIYSAVVRGAANKSLGGVAVIFDSAPQLSAILQDSLPRTESGDVAAGCIGVFTDANGKVIAATDRFGIGDKLNLTGTVNESNGVRILPIDGHYYAVGACKTTGYREYVGLDATAYVLIPLGEVVKQSASLQRTQNAQRKTSAGEQVVDIATFYCGDQWLGILREHVVESIGSDGLRPMPNRPAWYAGCLMYHGDPLPVVDLGRLTGRTADDAGSEVIVIHARSGEQRLGLLVNSLGGIPEVAISELLPVAEALFNTDAGVVDRAVRPQHPTDPVLLILSIERIFAQLRSPEPLTRSAAPKVKTI
jgi:chemotaxis signal transduction protein